MAARSFAHWPQLWQPQQFDQSFTYMKRLLPFIIILAVLGIALVSAWYFTRTIPASTTAAGSQSQQPSSRGSQAPQTAEPVVNKGALGAEPAHVLGPANAPARLEEL